MAEDLFMAFCHKQVSADIKIYNYKIKTSFVSPELPEAQANKTGFNIMILNFYIRKNRIYYDT